MSLNPQILKTEIRKFTDPNFAQFASWPENIMDSARRFANAIGLYASTVIPPSTTVEAAKVAFIGIFVNIVGEPVENGPILLPQAFQSFCVALGGGMAPAFVAVPPIWTGNEFRSLQILGEGGASAEQCADLFANIVDVKFRSGTATNTSSGVVVPWS